MWAPGQSTAISKCAQAALGRASAQQAQALHEFLGPGAAQDFFGGLFLCSEKRGHRFGAQAGLLLADGPW